MRWLVIAMSSLGLTIAAHAAPQITIAQLEQFLFSKQIQRYPDADLALRLSSITLAEQLTRPRLARIRAERRLGPKANEQLELLAAASIFSVPPQEELPEAPAPDPDEQQRMIGAAVDYVDTTLQQLPDFLATRATLCFDNSPRIEGGKHPRQVTDLHFARESRREIAYRDGHEVTGAAATGGKASREADVPGLTTWGEFGAMLSIVLSDSFKGSVEWSRWQMSEVGARVAVFRYTVPRPASHFRIDLCCDLAAHPFHDNPGYHGEIYLDPASGAIDRITLETELDANGPLKVSGLAVQYGHIEIGGKDYICPIRSIALTAFPSLVIEEADGIGLARYLNEVRFFDYHKFASTARVIAVDPDAVPQ